MLQLESEIVKPVIGMRNKFSTSIIVSLKKPHSNGVDKRIPLFLSRANKGCF